MHSVLHLSDLHYGKLHRYDQGTDMYARSLSGAVAQAVRTHIGDRSIDALVLTGDFFCYDLPSDKAKATDGIQGLIRDLDIPPERVVSLPGNHDLSWDPSFKRNRFRFYDEMVQETKIHGFVCDALPGLLVLPPASGAGKGVAVLLLNSCVMEGEETAGFGRVGERQLDQIRTRLRSANVSHETHVLIAALHHHLLPVVPLVRNWTTLDPRDGKPILTSLTVDAVAVLQRLTELGFSLAIHGHQHHSAVRRVEDLLLGHPGIGVCAAGSCGSSDAIRQFFLYEVEEAQTRVWSFEQSRHDDSAFVRREQPILLPNVSASAQKTEDLQSNLQKGGIRAIYMNRNIGERSLEKAFHNHVAGEVRLTGASLRLFLAPGLHFYEHIEAMLARRGDNAIGVRAVMCSPEINRELPVRSFIEEFGQNGEHPRVRPFDWSRPIDFDFSAFEASFFEKHGERASGQSLRVIQDLRSTRAGIVALRGVATSAGNTIQHRETAYAPYCTAVIFPEQAFYTPNLLCATVPANMPMMVFDSSSDGYRKLVDYFEFQWWLAEAHGSGQRRNRPHA